MLFLLKRVQQERYNSSRKKKLKPKGDKKKTVSYAILAKENSIFLLKRIQKERYNSGIKQVAGMKYI